MLDKTLYWLIEQFAAPVIGGFMFLVLIVSDISSFLFKDVVIFSSKISDIGFIIFGFLLAFLGLLMSSEEKFEKALGSKTIINRAINFNLRLITLSAVLGIFGLLIWIIFQSNAVLSSTWTKTLIGLLIWALVWLTLDVVYFIRIFFMMLNSRK